MPRSDLRGMLGTGMVGPSVVHGGIEECTRGGIATRHNSSTSSTTFATFCWFLHNAATPTTFECDSAGIACNITPDGSICPPPPWVRVAEAAAIVCAPHRAFMLVMCCQVYWSVYGFESLAKYARYVAQRCRVSKVVCQCGT